MGHGDGGPGSCQQMHRKMSPGPGTEGGPYTCILEAKTSWLEHEFALGDGGKAGQGIRKALLRMYTRFSCKYLLRMDGKEV